MEYIVIIITLLAGTVRAETAAGPFLFVSSTPAGAAVTVNGTGRGTTPCRIAVTAGIEVSVTVAHPGYRTVRRTVTVRSHREHLDVTLEPAAGSLDITSDPSGGTVYLNGNAAGRTPLRIDNIRCGTYDVRLTLAGYADYTARTEVTEHAPAAVTAVFAEYGALFVESDPLGAAVHLNGVRAGTTPVRLANIPSGACAVRVTHDGYEPYETDVTVTADTRTTVSAVLQRGFAALPVTTDPPGAELALDGTPRGRTPADLARIPFGAHRLHITYPGYADTVMDIRVESAAPTPLRVLLTPEPSRLAVTVSEPGARLMIDGTPVPPGQRDFGLRPGRHTVTATHPAYAAVSHDVTLAPGTVTDLRLAFERRTRLGAALRSAVLPGWGQYRSGYTEKAFFIWALQGAGIIAAAVTYARTADAVRTYDEAEREYYDTPGDATDAERRDAYDRLATERGRYLLAAGLAAALWTVNIGDALIVPPRRDRGFGLATAPPAAVALQYRF